MTRGPLGCVALTGVVLFSFSPGSHAQVREEWARQFDAPPMKNDFSTAIAVDAAGNAYVTGRSFNAGVPPLAPTLDVETIAYDPSGTLLWSMRYDSGSNADDQAYAIAVSPQGDVYVAGQTAVQVGSNFVTQQLVIKYAASGTQLWAHQYGNPAGPNVVRSILVDASGYVFLGGTDGGPNGTGDMCVRKLDPSGSVLWTATYDGSQHGSDYVHQIAFTPTGGVVAAGNVGDPASNFTDLAVISVSPAGSVVWSREVDGTAHQDDNAYGVAVDPDGVVYAAGYLTPSGHGRNGALFTWDAGGTPTFFSPYLINQGNLYDELHAVIIDPFGRAVVMGLTNPNGPETDWYVRTFSLHSTINDWEWRFDTSAQLDDVPRAMRVDAIGNIYIAGDATTSVSPTTEVDAVVIELDPNGEMRFEEVSGPNTREYADLALASDDGVVLAGHADNGGVDGNDYLTVRLQRTAVPFCFGDGSGTACPCAGTSDIPQAGCQNSVGINGHLFDTGASRLSADTLALFADNMPSTSALYFQGTTMVAGGAGSPFGDGLRCAGGAIVRLGTKASPSGYSRYPLHGDAPVHERGGVSTPGTRTYQVWYRNAAPYCTPATFNLTNGLRVTWIP